jgi:uncharacterized protein
MPEQPVSQPVHRVERRLDVRIPMSDGLELSANLGLPVAAADGENQRCPAILEMIPYRKDDWRANGDEVHGRYFASRGYAFCRLDVRGTGSSAGIAVDEYTARETQDGYEAVEWLAAQPWCNGRVGMWGISYGGFTSIQVAALRPPALKAIVPMYATDDRYTDDVHYVGGVPTASELTQYAVSMVAMNALPPRPSYRGEGWLDEWRERIERTPIWLVEWLRQQRDRSYWRQGSLAPDYDRIEAAILMFGGWMDSYIDPVFRMLERCTAPRRAIVGNWVHQYPHDGYPGPNLDWLHEMVRFYDHWLKSISNGVMDEAPLTWFRREWAPPQPFPRSWPGEWLAETSWPLAERGSINLYPAPAGVLARVPPSGAAVERLVHRPTVGTRGSLSWGAGGPPNGLARDLRPDEALGPVWTSEPLAAAVDVLGRPTLVLGWRSPVRVATAVVRLSDVAPDGTPSQVTAGILNLTHRDGHERPEPLPVGQTVPVSVPMRATGYRFAAGHRIRVSVASAAWPVAWPSPESAVHDIVTGGPDPARLILPWAMAPGSAAVPRFRLEPPALDVVGGGTDDDPAWVVTNDVLAGTVSVRTFEGGEAVTDDGTRLYASEGHLMTARDADPAVARMTSEVRYRLSQDGHEITADADAEMTSTADAFHHAGELRVTLDGAPFATRTWDEAIPRDLC